MQYQDPIAKLLGEFAETLNIGSVCLRISIAVILAAIIGCERANKRHSAGLRTFILIAFASTTTMILDLFICQITSIKIPVLSAATIVGMAMLSVNSILFNSKNQIKGLTTSAGLWACGILGLTIGAGLYTVSLITFVALFIILKFLPPVEVFLRNRSNHFEIHLELNNRANLKDFVTTVRKLGMTIVDIEVNNAYLGTGLAVYTIMFTVDGKELKKYKTHEEIISALNTLDYVYHIEEMK